MQLIGFHSSSPEFSGIFTIPVLPDSLFPVGQKIKTWVTSRESPLARPLTVARS
jgi:hypothetical protein